MPIKLHSINETSMLKSWSPNEMANREPTYPLGKQHDCADRSRSMSFKKQ